MSGPFKFLLDHWNKIVGVGLLTWVLSVIARPRLVADFDYDDPLCNEPVTRSGVTYDVLALRVRVRHVFGSAAKGVIAKLVEFRAYGSEGVIERGGQPLPWKDRDTSDGIRLARGDIEYANVAEISVNYKTSEVALATNTPRGNKRLATLPTGAYLCTVAIDPDRGNTARVSFGFCFDAEAKVKTGKPVLMPIPGSVERTPVWRIWLGV